MRTHNKKRALLYSTRSAISQFSLALSDLIAFNLGPLIAALLVTTFFGNLNAYIPETQAESRLSAHTLLSVLCVAWFWVRLRHYTYRKPFWFELKEILRTILLFAVIDLAISAFSKWQISRYVWVFSWGSILVSVPLLRFTTKNLLKRFNFWSKQCVIIGSGQNAIEAFQALQSETSLGFDIHFFFSPTPLQSKRQQLAGRRVIDNEELLWRTTDSRNTQYIIALDDGQGKNRAYWLKKFAMRKCRAVSVVPTMRGLPLNSTDMSFIFRHEVLLLRINTNLTKKSARIIKRSFDIVVSFFILLLLSPVILIISILILMDGSTPIYSHNRIGRNGKEFRCLKFRSMIKNSQEILNKIIASDPIAKMEWEKDFKLKNDPRITKLGSFLRKTSLDELPQLFNVLRGDMSLVGPRPITLDELDRYGENKEYYLMAKPGMTGLWQISGRNDVDYEKRIYFDAWYVKNWSLWNDTVILFKTINVVLKRDGAY